MKIILIVTVIAGSFWLSSAEGQNRNPTPAQIDSLNKTLDNQTDQLSGVDSLRSLPLLDVAAAVSFSKYLEYRKAVPLSIINVPPTAFVFDNQQILFYNPEYQKSADALINAIPDKLVGKRILLVDNFLKSALYMFDRSHYGTNDSVDGKPIRSGIKYGWGSKNPSKKLNPYIETRKADEPSDCNESITGLDCSGFLYQIFVQSGFPKIPVRNADDFREVPFLQSILNSYFDNSNRFAIRDFDRLDADSISSGDIIYFYQWSERYHRNVAFHIGMALQVNSRLLFFNSSGGPNICPYNVGDSGGVVCPDLKTYLKTKMKNKKNSYGVIKFTVLQ